MSALCAAIFVCAIGRYRGRLHVRLSPLICSILPTFACPSFAAQDERFVEFPGHGQIETYDLNTVKMMQPGRFTIMETTIDDADVMKQELKVLDALRSYCKRSDGHYPPPSDFFTLGSPDMPIRTIDVVTYSKQTAEPYKVVYWYYPYERLTIHTNEDKVFQKEVAFNCADEPRQEEKAYRLQRETILHGSRSKWLFDCRRGLRGFFVYEESNDPSTAFTYFVTPGTHGEEVYVNVCPRVTHEKPYTPKIAPLLRPASELGQLVVSPHAMLGA